MLKKLTKTLREMIRRAVDPSAQDKADNSRMDVDDFGPIRISAAQSAQGVGAPSGNVEASSRLFSVAVSLLTSGPFLQSLSREPSRDSELVELVVRACEESVPVFTAICPALLQEARKGTLALHPHQLCTLLESIGAVLKQYVSSKSHTLRLLLLEVLHSTIDVWESQAGRQSEVRTVVQTFLSFFAGFATNQLQSSWGLRKNLAEFMTHYLEVDPTAELWKPADQDGNILEDRLPLYLLRQMNFDDDMRVRFPAAVLSGHVMALSSKLGLDPPTAYQDFRTEEAELDYPLDVDKWVISYLPQRPIYSYELVARSGFSVESSISEILPSPTPLSVEEPTGISWNFANHTLNFQLIRERCSRVFPNDLVFLLLLLSSTRSPPKLRIPSSKPGWIFSKYRPIFLGIANDANVLRLPSDLSHLKI